ncbi:MAG: DUF2889 domain-containing protein [Deltaproteobacteria bacterium]|nr:DUF2889 domain-containing protein [Deltaproteobacteria bacterium]
MDERKELPENRGKLVHTRKIEIRTYDLGDHRVLVEGELADQRIPPMPAGDQKRGPVLVHHLIARIWVQGPDLTISAVEAEMPRIPREMCPEVLPGVQKLVGLKIITGFTQKVKDLIGDVRGCSHLTNLFLTLGPAAVQGYWAAYGRSLGARSLDHPAISRVMDSCHVWRKDGPYVRSLMTIMEKERKGA